MMALILVADLCLAIFAALFSVAFEVCQRFVQRNVITVGAAVLKIALTSALLFLVSANVL